MTTNGHNGHATVPTCVCPVPPCICDASKDDAGADRECRPPKPCLARLGVQFCGLPDGHKGGHMSPKQRELPKSGERLAVVIVDDGKPKLKP